jgi:hypothetical protein
MANMFSLAGDRLCGSTVWFEGAAEEVDPAAEPFLYGAQKRPPVTSTISTL